LRDSLRFFKDNYIAMTCLLLPVVAFEFFSLSIVGLTGDAQPASLTELSPKALAILFSTLVVLEPLAAALVCRYVYRKQLGHGASFIMVFRDALSIAPALILLQLAILLGVAVGLQLFVIPGLVVWYLCSLALPAMCRDRLGVFEALRASWAYTKTGFNDYFPGLMLLILGLVLPLNLLSLVEWPVWLLPIWMLVTTVAVTIIDVYKCRMIDHLVAKGTTDEPTD